MVKQRMLSSPVVASGANDEIVTQSMELVRAEVTVDPIVVVGSGSVGVAATGAMSLTGVDIGTYTRAMGGDVGARAVAMGLTGMAVVIKTGAMGGNIVSTGAVDVLR